MDSRCGRPAASGLGLRRRSAAHPLFARTAITRSVLADGTNTYLYGNARLAQYQASMQYFGADGLGTNCDMESSNPPTTSKRGRVHKQETPQIRDSGRLIFSLCCFTAASQ